uniref:Kinocilin n=1 Tax=Cyclopterus lumpus TaxID=8103 RepID=A0A8C2ZKG6_CYCLU
MNPVSVGEYHGLRVGSALLCIVAGCIIIGVSTECDAHAVGGIFLGAGGLGLLIFIYPFTKAWLNTNHILPSFGTSFDLNIRLKDFFKRYFKATHCFVSCLNNPGNFRVHPAAANPAPDQPVETLRREGEYVWSLCSQPHANNFQRHVCSSVASCHVCVQYALRANLTPARLHAAELINTNEKGVGSRWLLQSINHLTNIAWGAVEQ